MNKRREDALWRDAVIVFDTSAIGTLYSLTQDARSKILNIFEHWKDRCWIPAHVLYEYGKNRNKFITNPIAERYQNPDFFKADIIGKISDYVSKVKEPDFHPYLDSDAISLIEEKGKVIEDALKSIKEEVKDQHLKRKNEIMSVRDNDSIEDAIDQMQHGEPFTFNEILDIVGEGEMRYRNALPPGYKDVSTKDGMQRYGDLIIWKEILRYAAKEHKSVIYINDDQKADIYAELEPCYIPRHELLREFRDATSCDFWMYPLKQFIDKMIGRYKPNDTLNLYTGLDKVLYALDKIQTERIRRKRNENIVGLCCKSCGHEIHMPVERLDWEDVGYSELEKGKETIYTSYDYCECPNCHKDFTITYRVYEYPMGQIEDTEVECDNADVVIKPRLDNKIQLQEAWPCVRCGRYDILNDEGLCDDCVFEKFSPDPEY